MADRRPPYHRRPTRPLPREKLAPIAAGDVEAPPETRPAIEEAKALARSAEDDIVTLARCPLCAGCGMVPPDVAAMFDALCEQAKEQT